MILSTTHRFIFVHVPKTAGTALTAALEPYGVIGTRTRAAPPDPALAVARGT